MQISLAYRHKKILESHYKMCQDKNKCDRIKAILLSDAFWSEEMISAALRKHQTIINRDLNEDHAGQKIVSNNKGSDSFLNEKQTALVIHHLSEVTYCNMSDIQEYINNTFDVKYSIPGLQKWLHQNKFSYKQLKGMPHNFGQEKQAVFVEEYNELIPMEFKQYEVSGGI